MRTFLFILPFLFISIGCEQTTTDQQLSDYPNSQLLIDATELNERLEESTMFLIDARPETGDTLIPGAIHFSAVSELIDSNHPTAGYLIGPDEFAQKMSALGLSNTDDVIIYDGGNNLAAARLFYALDYYGFSNTTLLNGGIQAWLANGYEHVDSPDVSSEGNFTVTIQEGLMCDFDYVTEAANSPDKVIFDARSTEEYTGETTRAERGGHIPNAVNFEWNRALQSEGIPYFLPAESLQSALSAVGITPDKEVIPHCQSNVRGSHAYFTLRLMGYDSVRPYEASWVEYGNRGDAVIQ